jgi:glycosyltransferase involved in cell wall biosynthesis
MARISVCLAAYNGERYIQAQLLSIVRQITAEDEIVISDDGSTDATVSICEQIQKSFSGVKIIILSGPRRGLIRNIENALAHASGRYIFLSDQDDIWLDTKVETILAKLSICDLIVTDCIVVRSDLQPIETSFFLRYSSGRGFTKNYLRNSYLGCCMAFKRNILDIALPFPERIAMHDWWIGLLADAFGKRIVFLDQPLLLYRRHGSNASDTGSKSKASLLKKIQWRVDMLRCVLHRRFIGG